jgi:hypothetical protein
MVAMQLVPPTVMRSQTLLERMGFRYGERGTQSSRTIMLEELRALLAAVPGAAERDEYHRAVLEGNCLGKRTAATRKLSFQRLSELYGLNPAIPLFRILRDLWPIHPKSQSLLALLLALARDPLLRITASPVHETPIGNEFTRQVMIQVLDGEAAGRFNPSTLDKIARNASSSWTQSGHLRGRVHKFRQKVTPTPVSCAYALLLAHVQGARGQALFESPWVRVLDLDTPDARDLADEARRLGLLDLKQSGTIIELAFPQFLASKDLESMNGSH